MKKNYLFLILLVASQVVSHAQGGFFDPVTFRGAFPVSGVARTTANGYTGYNPDPNFTAANWALSTSSAGWVEWDPQNVDYSAKTANKTKVVISGDISSNQTWDGANNWYELSGTVHVLSGAKLTITAGTIIRGSVSNVGVLIITRGAQIDAQGTSSNPIVITSGQAIGSRKAGDWGGLLVLGYARINSGGSTGTRVYEALPSDPLATYGGNNDYDNSGVMKFIRVEYAGYNFLPDQEINGITFAGVGNQTKADYLQTSYSRDDSFEWFGGTVNHKYLISFASVDDEFDMDEGYRGLVQHILGMRHPNVFETSAGGTSNSLEHDNNTGLTTASQVVPGVNDPQPATAPVISNATVYGPVQGDKASSSLVAGHKFGRGMEIRTNAQTSVFNSVITGFPTLFQTGNPSGTTLPSVQGKIVSGLNAFQNNNFSGNGLRMITTNNTPSVTAIQTAGIATGSVNDGASLTWFKSLPNITDPTSTAGTNLGFSSLITSPTQFVNNYVDFTLQSTSPLATATVSFSNPIIAQYTSTPLPTIAVPSNLLPFNVLTGVASAPTKVDVSFANFSTTGFGVTAPANFGLSESASGPFVTTINPSATGSGTFSFYVVYTNTIGGSNQGNISITNSLLQGSVSIGVSGSAVAPARAILNLDKSALSLNDPSGAIVAGAYKSFNVFATLLTGPVTVTGSSVFQVSTSSTSGWSTSLTLSPVNGTVNQPVFVAYPQLTGNTDNGTVTVSTGTASESVSVTAVSSPTYKFTPGSLPNNISNIVPLFQWLPNTQSAPAPINITAFNLPASGLTISGINSDFKVSLSSTTGWTSGNFVIPVSGDLSTTLWVVQSKTAANAYTVRTPGFTLQSLGGPSLQFNLGGATLADVTVNGIAVYKENGIAFSSFGNNISNVEEVPFYAVLGTNPTLNVVAYSGIAATSGTPFELATSASGPWYAYDKDLLGTTSTSSPISIPATGQIAGTAINTVSGSIFVRFNSVNSRLVSQSGDLIFYMTPAFPTGSLTPANTLINVALRAATFPDVSSDATSLPNFNTLVGIPSPSAPVRISGKRVVTPVQLSAPAGFELATSPNGTFAPSLSLDPTTSTGLFDQTVFVRYNSTSTVPSSGILGVANTNAPAISINVNGSASPAPAGLISLQASAATLTLSGNGLEMVSVSGTQLTAGVTVTAPANYSVSLSATTSFGASVVIPQSSIIGQLGSVVFGNVQSTVVYIQSTTAAGLASVTASSSAFTTAAPQTIAVTRVLGIEDDFVNGVTSLVLYPNPSNGDATLDLSLAKGSNVSITLHDVTGSEVSSINTGSISAGVYTYTLSNLKSGLYFVTVITDGFKKTEKLVVY